MPIKRPYGYWKSFENIERELKEITDSIGKVPSYTELREKGRADLAKAIQKNGGLNQFRILFGRENEIVKSLANYEDWDTISAEFKKVIDEIGSFPIAKNLKERKLFYLLDAAVKYHDGLPNIRRKLGYEENQKLKGYWDNIENVIDETRKLISKYNELPSSEKLLKEGYSSYVNAISTKHGGFSKIRELMGLDKLQEVNSGHWQSIDNIANEIKLLKEKINKDPLPSDFKLHGKSNILHAIERHYNGLFSLYTRLNIPTDELKKPSNYYDNWENIKSEVEEIIESIGHFPSDQELLFLERTSFRNGVKKHGGLRKVAERLGVKHKYVIANDGHYCDSFAEKIIDDILFAQHIKHERGITFLLNEKKLVPDFILENNIVVEVLMVNPYVPSRNKIETNYSKRFLQKKRLYKEHNYEVFDFLPEHYTNSSFLKQRFKDLINKIGHISDGLDEVISHNIFFDNKKPIGYWLDFENVKNTLLPICKDLGRFPRWSEIESMVGTGIIKAIKKYHKSLENVADKMECTYQKDAIRKSNGFWKEINNVIKELNKVIEAKGEFPKASYLHKNYATLYYAINKYHSGLKQIKQKTTTVKR